MLTENNWSHNYNINADLKKTLVRLVIAIECFDGGANANCKSIDL